MGEQEGILVPSTNRGRFALDDAVEGRDITSGDVVSLLVDGQWVAGQVEHSLKHHGGYYLLAHNGNTYPLRAGMKARLR